MNDIAAWLENLGLGKYQEIFTENDVDFEVLPALTEQDLEKLGLSLGHRKKLLKAIAALSEDDAEAENTATVKIEHSPSISPMRLQAERRQLTVMFVDLVGSTALSGQLDPEDLSVIMRRYQNTVSGEINRLEGFVAKFMGDGVLAYFGWPRAHEDEAERAVRAGFAITAEVAKLRTPDGQTLAARIGIATGLVVVGDLIGEGAAQEEAVVGETPNLAARLQDIAEPNSVVISASTRRLCGELFELQNLGPQQLKGIAGPVDAYRMLGERASESRYQALHAGAVLPLVGRERELAELQERWRQAENGEGQVILLSAEAGIGKSRTLRALTDALEGQAYYRINYQCSPYHTDSALYPAIQQLTRAAGFAADDDDQAKLEQLEALLARGWPQGRLATLSRSVPLMAALLGIDAEQRYGSLDLSPQQQRSQTLQTLVEQLTGLAQHRPVLWILEDAHWIDPTTLELIELALDPIALARVLLLITARPIFEHGFGGHPAVTRLVLNRLGHDSSRTIIELLGGGKRLPEELLDEIVGKTDGVPLFIEELTKTVLESGLLRETEKAYLLDGPLHNINIPSSLYDSLMARLDRLATVKEVAQLGAVIGRQFSAQLLAAVSPLDSQTLQHALVQLVEAELLYRRGAAPDARYTFKHALVQDAAYQSLLKSTRQRYHRQIAQVLEERFPETTATQPELVAHHYSEASLSKKAGDYWQRAAERAIQRSANAEAITHLRRGLELLASLPDTPERSQRELDLLTALGPVLLATKGYAAAEVVEVCSRARELCQQLGETPELVPTLFNLVVFYMARSEHRTAMKLGEQCLALAQKGQDDDPFLAAHLAIGMSLFYLGQPAPARTHLGRVIARYDPERHRGLAFRYGGIDLGVASIGYCAWSLWMLGYPEQARAHSDRALTLARHLAHPYTLARTLYYDTMLHQLDRDKQAVYKQAEATIAVAEEQGFALVLALGPIMRGWAVAVQDQSMEGMAQMRQGLELYRATGAEFQRAHFLTMLAEASGALGQADGATALDEALSLMERTGENYCEAELHRLRGELLLMQTAEGNRQAQAEACYRKALDVAGRQQARSLELRAAVSLARLWRDQDKRWEARDLLAPVYDWFTEGFDTADLKDAKALLDELA